VAIAYVSAQSCHGQQGGVTADTFSITGSAITAGSTLCVLTTASALVSSVPANWVFSDNAGNSYAPQVRGTDAGGAGYVVFTCLSSIGAPTQFTIADSLSENFQWMTPMVDVFTGVSALTFGTSNSQGSPGTGTDVITTGSFTPPRAGCTIWCGLSQWTDTSVHGTGFTTAQDSGAAFVDALTEYKMNASGAAQAATFTDATNGGSNFFNTIAISLTPAASSHSSKYNITRGVMRGVMQGIITPPMR
jgi:hypothetical protein